MYIARGFNPYSAHAAGTISLTSSAIYSSAPHPKSPSPLNTAGAFHGDSAEFQSETFIASSEYGTPTSLSSSQATASPSSPKQFSTTRGASEATP